MVRSGDDIFVSSTFSCWTPSLGLQSSHVLKGKLNLHVVAVICFGKLFTMSSTKPQWIGDNSFSEIPGNFTAVLGMTVLSFETWHLPPL